MADLNTVSEAAFRAKFEDGMSRGADAAAAAMRRLGAAAAEAGNEQEKAAERVRRADRTYEQAARKYDEQALLASKVAKAHREYEQTVKAVTTALETGAKKQEEVTTVLKNAQIARDAAIRAAEQEAEAHKRRYAALDAELQKVNRQSTAYVQTLHDIAAAESRVNQIQNIVNRYAGVNFADEQYSKSRAADIAAYGEELDRLRAKFNPLFAVQQQYMRTLEELNRAEKVGAINSLEAAQARDRLRISYDQQVQGLRRVQQAATQAGSGVNYTGYQLTQLSYQLNDVIAQMATGTSPFIILSQQGPQVAQILGGWRQMFRDIAGMMTPFRLGLVAATAAMGTLLAVVNSIEGRLSELRNGLRAFTSDYDNMARSIEESSRRQSLSSPGFGLSDITQAQLRLTQAQLTSGIRRPVEELTELAKDLSRTLDKDLAQASERVARAMRDPAQVAKDLAENGFPGMTESLRRTIEVFQLGGDRATAFNLLFDSMKGQFRGAAEDVSPFQKALNELTTSLERLWEVIRPGLELLGRGLFKYFNDLAQRAIAFAEALEQINRGINRAERSSNTGTPGGAWRGGATDFQSALRSHEGGAAGYGARNQYGYLGAYQFGVPALVDTGLYTAGPRDRIGGRWMNNWTGTWNIPGVSSAEDFLANPAAQDEAFRRYIARIDEIIDKHNLLREGLTINGVPVTRDALRGAGWAFPGRLAEFVNSGGQVNPADGNGQTMLERFLMFSRNTSQGGTVPVTIMADRSRTGPDPSLPTPPIPPAYGAESLEVQRALREARTLNPLEDNRVNAMARIQSFTTARAEIEKQNELLRAQQQELDRGSEAWNNYQERISQNAQNIEILNRGIDTARATIATTRTATEEYIERLEKQAEAAVDAGTAHQVLAERMRGLEEAALRERGTGPTQDEVNRVRAATLRELSVQYSNTIDSIDRQVASEERLTQAYMRGSAAGAEAEAVERAREEVRKTTLRGTQLESDAVENLTRKYQRLTTQQVERATAARSSEMRLELEAIRAETQLIGANVNVRERELAVLRARQDILRRDPNADLGSDANQQNLRLAEQVAAARLEQERITSAFQEVQNIGVRAFDRIGEAITQAFADGSLESINFKNIAKAAISEIVQAALKLAIINPVLNIAVGGNYGTASDVGGIIGGMFGYTGVGAGGGSFGGLLSSLSSLGGSPAIAPTGHTRNRVLVRNQDGGYSIQEIGGLGMNLNTLMGGGIGGAGAQTGLMGKYLISPTQAIDPVTGMPYNVSGSGLTVAQGIGAGASIIGGAYGIYSGLQRGGIGGYTQAAGGAVGVAGGAATLGVAAMGGASAAAASGALGAAMAATAAWAPYIAAVLAIASMFLPGQKPSNREGNALINLGTGEITIGGQEGKKFSGANRDAAEGIAKQVDDLANELGTILGTNIAAWLQVGVGDRDGVYYAWQGGPRQRFKRSEDGIAQMIESITGMMIQHARGEVDPEVRSIIDHSGGSVQQIIENMQWYREVYEVMEKAHEPASQFEQSLKDITKRFDEVIQQAHKLGLSERELLIARDELIRQAYEQRDFEARGLDVSLFSRAAAASRNPGRQLYAQFVEMDYTHWSEQRSTEEQLRNLGFGSGTEHFQSRMAQLRETQAIERQNLMNDIAADFQDLVKTAFGGPTLLDTVEETTKRYNEAIEAARMLGLAEADLVAARDKAVQKLWEQRHAEYWRTMGNLDARMLRTVGTPQANMQAALIDFDLNAQLEMERLKQSLFQLGLEGTQEYYNAIVKLEQVLAAERLDVIESFHEQARSVTINVIEGLLNYAQSLRYGTLSPMNARQRYISALEDFNSTRADALTGDPAALREMQSVVQAFLEASRDVHGSGASYFADFERALEAIGAIGEMDPDTLTASFFAEQQRESTDILKDQLIALRTEVTLLRSEIRQGALIPAKVT